MQKSKARQSINAERIRQLKKTVFIAISASAVVISISIVVFVFLAELWGYNSRVQSAQSEALDTLEQNQEIYQDLEQGFSELESAEGTNQDPDDTIVLNALPGIYDFPALASSIQKLADSSDVELTGFAGSDEEATAPEPSYSTEPYEMFFGIEVTGSYEDIQVFVDTLDQSIRPFKVYNMELRGADDALRVDLSLSTHFQPRQNLDYPERTID